MMRVIIGIGLMVVAFAALFLFIAGPENPLVRDVMTALTCQSGERFTQVMGGYVYSSDGSSGQSFTFYCQDEAGNQRDVTGMGVIYGIAGFVVPFVVGLVLTLVGAVGTRRSRANPVMSVFGQSGVGFQTDALGQPIQFGADQPSKESIQFGDVPVTSKTVQGATVVTVNGREAQMSDLPPETAKLVEQALGSLGTMMSSANFVNMSAGAESLSDKLRQLQEARDKNLITPEEYERLRKEILDKIE